MSRAMGDVDEVQSFLVNGIDQILGDGLLWLETVVLVLVSTGMFSQYRCTIDCRLLPAEIFQSQDRTDLQSRRDQAGECFDAIAGESLGRGGHQAFGREEQESRRFRGATESYYRQQVRAIIVANLFFPFSRVVGSFSNVFMIGVGGYSILTGGGFTVGTLLAFGVYLWGIRADPDFCHVNDMIQRAVAGTHL